MGEMRSTYKHVGKPDRKEALGIPRRSSEDNIKMHLKNLDVGWIYLA
jgi:hypothetical protein